MMARRLSPLSARTGLPGGIRGELGLGIGTTRGSSRIQFANSLLISASAPSLALTATARSSEPSPLKSPTAKLASRETSGVAALSKTRATVSRISMGSGGAADFFAGLGVGVGDINGSRPLTGASDGSTRGGGSELLACSVAFVQAEIGNTVSISAMPSTTLLILLRDIERKPPRRTVE